MNFAAKVQRIVENAEKYSRIFRISPKTQLQTIRMELPSLVGEGQGWGQ